MIHEPGTPLAAILERLLVSERPVAESSIDCVFSFLSDTNREVFITVKRDYSRNTFGEWVITDVSYGADYCAEVEPMSDTEYHSMIAF